MHDDQQDKEALKKQKIAVALTGASFALICLLFANSVLSSDKKPSLAMHENDTESPTQLYALQQQVHNMTTRIEQMEQNHARLLATHQAPSEEATIAYTSQPVDTPEQEAPNVQTVSAMTHESIHMFISKQSNAHQLANAHQLVATTDEKQDATLPAQKDPENITYYTVKKGDTLSLIAKKFYGNPNKWKIIYDANKANIHNMDNVKVGTSLIIPHPKETNG